MKLPRAYYEAIATLTGCIIGAGILGIPYVVVRSGFWTGFLMIFVLGFASLIIHLLAGEISLRSGKCHQLAGYAEKYLGRKGKLLMTASMVIGVYGAMLAYTIGVSRSLNAVFGGSAVFWGVVFYLVMAVLLFGGLSMLERSELAMEIFKLFLFLLIIGVLVFAGRFNPGHLTGFSFENLLVPFGVILFAYIGTAAIPEVREELNKCRLLTRRVIIIGSVVPIIVYALFTLAVVGVSGFFTTEVATIGLAPIVGGFGFVILHLFAILAMATSFVALGYALRETYRLDFKMPHYEAWALTLGIPVALMLVGLTSFVRTLEVAGTFAGGIAGITIVFMHWRAKMRSERKPEYKVRINWIGYSLLIGLFVIGMLYELFVLVR